MVAGRNSKSVVWEKEFMIKGYKISIEKFCNAIKQEQQIIKNSFVECKINRKSGVIR